jgi:hypothetical protein
VTKQITVGMTFCYSQSLIKQRTKKGQTQKQSETNTEEKESQATLIGRSKGTNSGN